MRIVRQSPTELVAKDSTLWLSVVSGAAALALIFFGIESAKPSMFLVAGFFLLFATITARGTTFTFDGLERVGRWQSYWVFRARSGTVRLDDIRDVTVEAMSTDRNAVTYRLVLQTANGPVPMSNAYSASRDGYAKLRREVLAFLKPGLDPSAHEPQKTVDGIPADLASSLHSLVAQGRIIDAVTLLRARQRMSLTEARKRIDAIDAKMKIENHVAHL